MSIDRATNPDPIEIVRRALPPVAAAAACVLPLVGLIVLARWPFFTRPVPGPALVAAAVVADIALLALVHRRQREGSRLALVVAVAAAVVAAALLVALTAASDSRPAQLVSWGLVGMGLAAAWLLPRSQAQPPVADPRGVRAPEPSSDALVTQLCERTRTADGETIAGTLRAELEPGQRIVQFHLAFCPPLASAPRIEIEQIDGPEARWKPAQSWAHAARIEGKLAANAAPGEQIAIEFVAIADAK